MYEVVRNNLATLLAGASEVEHGLPRYVERHVSYVLGVRCAGATDWSALSVGNSPTLVLLTYVLGGTGKRRALE